MLKSQYLILAVTLLIGSALGFMDILHLSKERKSTADNRKSTTIPHSAPLFPEKPTKKDITQIEPVMNNLDALIPLYAGMTGTELSAELTRVLALSKSENILGENTSFIVNYLIAKLGKDFPEEVRPWLENHPENTRACMKAWARGDFDSAMEYLLEKKNKWEYTSSLFTFIIEELAESHPDKAMEWGMTQTGRVRQLALSHMITALAEKHFDKFSDFVSKLTPEDLKQKNMISDISKNWARHDWEKAMRWGETLPENEKNTAIVQVLGGLSSTNLEKATEEFKKQPRSIKSDIAREIVKILEGSNGDSSDTIRGKKALEWLTDNSSDLDNAGKLTRNIVNSSTLLTPEFTAAVQKLPEGTVKDHALRGLSNMTAYRVEDGKFTYEDAFVLTNQIKDPQTQKESTIENVRVWINNDPEGARIWIEEKSGFTNEEKETHLRDCEESLKLKKTESQSKRKSHGNVIIISRDD